MAETKKSAEQHGGFTPEERAAMKERAKELKADAAKQNGVEQVLARIAEMSPADRKLAGRVHEIVMAAAPDLVPRLWYGMPAYATKDGKTLCFFQDAQKFKSRYSTLGFQDPANLDDGTMWATSFALTALTDADEKRIADLVKRANA